MSDAFVQVAGGTAIIWAIVMLLAVGVDRLRVAIRAARDKQLRDRIVM